MSMSMSMGKVSTSLLRLFLDPQIRHLGKVPLQPRHHSRWTYTPFPTRNRHSTYYTTSYGKEGGRFQRILGSYHSPPRSTRTFYASSRGGNPISIIFSRIDLVWVYYWGGNISEWRRGSIHTRRGRLETLKRRQYYTLTNVPPSLGYYGRTNTRSVLLTRKRQSTVLEMR